MNYANPIYDTAFKGLIRDKDIAKEIIGTLLKTEVFEIDLNITEWNKPKTESDSLPRSVRLDYCATILNENGEKQKILIEIQKTSNPDDILRFREYLAIAGYGDTSENKHSTLPIVTFYFLGFELENVNTPCLKVARQYLDMIEDKVLNTKEKFIELLTHDSYVIQIPRIKNEEKPQSKLEKILSIFEQYKDHNSDHLTLFYRFPIEDDYIRQMIGKLHYIIANPVERKSLNNDYYWYRHDDMLSGEILRKDKEIANVKKQLNEVRNQFIENAKAFKKLGLPIDDITKMTGLSKEEVEVL